VKTTSKFHHFLISFLLIAILANASASGAIAGASPYDMPKEMDRNAKYVIFLHNYYVEKNGPDGDCEYFDLLKMFSEKGYRVVSELRTGKILPCTYAEKVATQVVMLLDAGVPPRQITVAGHSKGGVIALCAASQLKNPELNFVIMAGCEIAPIKKYKMYPDFGALKGRILSIFATSDKVAGSCKEAFSEASGGLAETEITLVSEKGHKLFFAPEALWVSPTLEWMNRATK